MVVGGRCHRSIAWLSPPASAAEANLTVWLEEEKIPASRKSPSLRDEPPDLAAKAAVLPISRGLTKQRLGELTIGDAPSLHIEHPDKKCQFERLPVRSRRLDSRCRRAARVLGKAPEGQCCFKPFGMPGIETRLRHKRCSNRWRIDDGEEKVMLNANGWCHDQMIPIRRRATGLSPAPAVWLKPNQAARGNAVGRRRQPHMPGESIGAPEHEGIQAGPVGICEDIGAPSARRGQAPDRRVGLEARERTRPSPLDTRRSVASARRRAFPATGSPYIDKRRRAALASMGAWYLSVRGKVGLSPSFPP